MSVRKLTLEIVAGDKTCASETGEFCPHLRAADSWSSSHQCQIFGGRLKKPIGRPNETLQRLPQCLEAEDNSTSTR